MLYEDDPKVKAKIDEINASKETIKTLIISEDSDTSKWKISDIVSHIINIEKILGLR